MIEVPAALRQEIDKLRGRKLQARVRIDYSDFAIDATISATTRNAAVNTYLEQIYNGRRDMSAKWFSLNESVTLDGTYQPAPVTARDIARFEIGWWSQELSIADNTFPQYDQPLYGSNQVYGDGNVYGASKSYPYVQLFFTPRTLTSIDISFDNQRMEYGADLDVVFYDSDYAVLYTETVTGNTGVRVQRTFASVANCVSLQLIIKKWSHSYRQAKIAEFFTSVFEEYTGDDILSLRIIENREDFDKIPVGTTMSSQCEVVLYNRFRKFDYDNTQSVLFSFIRDGVRITPFIGDGTTWVPLGVFFAREWEVPKKGITATVSGLDFLARLGETEFKTSKIIAAPADEQFETASGAEWAGGTLEGVSVDGNTIRMVLS